MADLEVIQKISNYKQNLLLVTLQYTNICWYINVGRKRLDPEVDPGEATHIFSVTLF